MPTGIQHLEQVRINEEIARVARDRFGGWAVTALFYAALHYIEAFFYIDPSPGEPQHYTHHAGRSVAVIQRLADVAPEYRILRSASEDARYRCVFYSPEDADRARILWYEPLKARMEAHIAQARSG